eukprot:522165-Alexandrium_andersonii.AAC.1
MWELSTNSPAPTTLPAAAHAAGGPRLPARSLVQGLHGLQARSLGHRLLTGHAPLFPFRGRACGWLLRLVRACVAR